MQERLYIRNTGWFVVTWLGDSVIDVLAAFVRPALQLTRFVFSLILYIRKLLAAS
jgi:hypothetical protein